MCSELRELVNASCKEDEIVIVTVAKFFDSSYGIAHTKRKSNETEHCNKLYQMKFAPVPILDWAAELVFLAPKTFNKISLICVGINLG
jgi:hypothetical protein